MNSKLEELLNQPLDAMPDIGAVPEGKYKVTCTSVDKREKKDGSGCFYMATFSIEDEPLAPLVSYFVPTIDMDKEDKFIAMDLKSIRHFLVAMGMGHLTAPQFSANVEAYGDELKGRSAWAYLRVKADDEYGDKNVIQRWLTKV